MDILKNERDVFIKSMKFDSTLSLRNKEDYCTGIRNAFDVAYNQYARREKKKYKEEKLSLIEPVAGRLYKYFNCENDTFESCFTDCIDLSKNILNNNRYGVAQKFTNMAFKYLYCFADSIEFEHKFKNCHMPLDKYTIHWVRSLKNKEINKRLTLINNAWANLDEKLYRDIQELIDATLKSNYNYIITYNKKSSDISCILPENKLYAEFIIWHQEKLNELYSLIKNSENEFERLGIKWI